MKLKDIRPDSWRMITLAIKNNQHPKEMDLVAALRRQESTIPGEAQIYLARLINGEIDKRGRPKLSKLAHISYRLVLVDRVDRWCRVFKIRRKMRNPKQMAFNKVAEEYGLHTGGSTKKYYREGKKLLLRFPFKKDPQLSVEVRLIALRMNKSLSATARTILGAI
jgi:hypothetical protein